MLVPRRDFLATALKSSAAALVACQDSSSAAQLPRIALRIAKTEFEIAPGHSIATTAYNGTVPGALLRLREGQPVQVEITNETSMEEYVHWHGLLVPTNVDGAEEEKSLAVPAHGTLRYILVPGPAGTRYVHSHAMAGRDLTCGTYSGQFGFVYIEPKHERCRYDKEAFLTTHEWEPYFSNDELDEQASEPVAQQAKERNIVTAEMAHEHWEIGYKSASINGRALGHGEPIRVKFGDHVLFHLLNASATENVRLSLPGHRFKVVALDGNPVPMPAFVDVLELGVGERIDAVVEMGTPGIWIFGSNDDVLREQGMGIVVEYAGRTGAPAWKDPTGDWDYSLFSDNTIAPKASQMIPMVISHIERSRDGFEQWLINGDAYSGKQEPVTLIRGRRYRFVFENKSDDAHPLHFHRSRFELIRVNGKVTSGLKKDVFLLKPFAKAEIDLVPTELGLLLFHCHQQFHMDSGFKKLFNVIVG